MSLSLISSSTTAEVGSALSSAPFEVINITDKLPDLHFAAAAFLHIDVALKSAEVSASHNSDTELSYPSNP